MKILGVIYISGATLAGMLAIAPGSAKYHTAMALVCVVMLGMGVACFRNFKPRLVVNLSLLGGACLLALLVVEITMMSLGMASSTNRIYYRISNEFHHDYYPNSSFISRRSSTDGGDRVRNRINSHGIRGPEFPNDIDMRGTILLLGDSFMQSDEIEYDEIVAERLNRMTANSGPYFIQHGIASWSPLLELNWIMKKGIELHPRAVILFLFVNDFYIDNEFSDFVYATETKFNGDGFPIGFDLGIEDRRLFAALRKFKKHVIAPIINSYTVNVVENVIKMKDYKATKQITEVQLAEILAADAESFDSLMEDLSLTFAQERYMKPTVRLRRPIERWEDATLQNALTTMSYIEMMRDTLESVGCELMVTLIPNGWNLAAFECKIGKQALGLAEIVIIPTGGIKTFIVDYCEDKNLSYLDLFTPLQEYSDNTSKEMYLSEDCHWNNFGHEVVSQILFDYLVENGYLQLAEVSHR